jgi:hypothetical protein
MQLSMKVTFADANVKTVTAKFADFVAFERTWNRSVAKFEQELRLTDLAWLAWHSEKRTQNTAMGFDPEWIGTIESVEMAEETTSDSPLEKGQQPG